MVEGRDRSAGGGRATNARPAPTPLLWPLFLGIVAGTAAFAAYVYWTHQKAQRAAETTTDISYAKPDLADCAVGRAVLSAIHASGEDARWRAALGPLTLKARTQVINPVDAPGYADDEAESLRGKAAADWRGCADMGAFVRSLGWSAMSDDEDIAEIGLGRAGISTGGDEAKVYEMVGAPQKDTGDLMLARGPWLVTLHRDGAVWRVIGRAEVKR